MLLRSTTYKIKMQTLDLMILSLLGLIRQEPSMAICGNLAGGQ